MISEEDALHKLQDMWDGNCNENAITDFQKRIELVVKEAFNRVRDDETEDIFNRFSMMSLLSHFLFLTERKSSDEILASLKAGLDLLQFVFLADDFPNGLEGSNVEVILSLLLSIQTRLYSPSVSSKKSKYRLYSINRRPYPLLVAVVAHAASRLKEEAITWTELTVMTSRWMEDSFCMDQNSICSGFMLYGMLCLRKPEINNYGITPRMLLQKLSELGGGVFNCLVKASGLSKYTLAMYIAEVILYYSYDSDEGYEKTLGALNMYLKERFMLHEKVALDYIDELNGNTGKTQSNHHKERLELVSYEYPLKIHVTLLLVRDCLTQTLKIVSKMEQCNLLNKDTAICAWGQVMDFLRQKGTLFLDGNGVFSPAYENKTNTLQLVVSKMGNPLGVDTLCCFYKGMVDEVEKNNTLSENEKIYITIASQHTLLKLLRGKFNNDSRAIDTLLETFPDLRFLGDKQRRAFEFIQQKNPIPDTFLLGGELDLIEFQSRGKTMKTIDGTIEADENEETEVLFHGAITKETNINSECDSALSGEKVLVGREDIVKSKDEVVPVLEESENHNNSATVLSSDQNNNMENNIEVEIDEEDEGCSNTEIYEAVDREEEEEEEEEEENVDDTVESRVLLHQDIVQENETATENGSDEAAKDEKETTTKEEAIKISGVESISSSSSTEIEETNGASAFNPEEINNAQVQIEVRVNTPDEVDTDAEFCYAVDILDAIDTNDTVERDDTVEKEISQNCFITEETDTNKECDSALSGEKEFVGSEDIVESKIEVVPVLEESEAVSNVESRDMIEDTDRVVEAAGEAEIEASKPADIIADNENGSAARVQEEIAGSEKDAESDVVKIDFSIAKGGMKEVSTSLNTGENNNIEDEGKVENDEAASSASHVAFTEEKNLDEADGLNHDAVIEKKREGDINDVVSQGKQDDLEVDFRIDSRESMNSGRSVFEVKSIDVNETNLPLSPFSSVASSTESERSFSMTKLKLNSLNEIKEVDEECEESTDSKSMKDLPNRRWNQTSSTRSFNGNPKELDKPNRAEQKSDEQGDDFAVDEDSDSVANVERVAKRSLRVTTTQQLRDSREGLEDEHASNASTVDISVSLKPRRTRSARLKKKDDETDSSANVAKAVGRSGRVKKKDKKENSRQPIENEQENNDTDHVAGNIEITDETKSLSSRCTRSTRLKKEDEEIDSLIIVDKLVRRSNRVSKRQKVRDSSEEIGQQQLNNVIDQDPASIDTQVDSKSSQYRRNRSTSLIKFNEETDRLANVEKAARRSCRVKKKRKVEDSREEMEDEKASSDIDHNISKVEIPVKVKILPSRRTRSTRTKKDDEEIGSVRNDDKMVKMTKTIQKVQDSGEDIEEEQDDNKTDQEASEVEIPEENSVEKSHRLQETKDTTSSSGNVEKMVRRSRRVKEKENVEDSELEKENQNPARGDVNVARKEDGDIYASQPLRNREEEETSNTTRTSSRRNRKDGPVKRGRAALTKTKLKTKKLAERNVNEDEEASVRTKSSVATSRRSTRNRKTRSVYNPSA